MGDQNNELLNHWKEILRTEMEALTNRLIESLKIDIVKLQEDTSTMKEVIKDLEMKNKSLMTELTEMSHKVDNLTTNIEMYDEKFTVLNGRISAGKMREKSYGDKVADLTHRIDDQEDRSKRNNLIIYGLEEDREETTDKVEEKVRKLLLTKGVISTAMIKIDRAHRIGKKVNGRNRPIVVRFTYFKDKVTILKNSKQLKNTPIRISEQYCKTTMKINEDLFRACKTAKEADSRIKRFWINYRYCRVLYNTGSKEFSKNFNIRDVSDSPNWYKIEIW